MTEPSVVQLMLTVWALMKLPPLGEKVGVAATGCSLTVPLKETEALRVPQAMLTLPEWSPTARPDFILT